MKLQCPRKEGPVPLFDKVVVYLINTQQAQRAVPATVEV